MLMFIPIHKAHEKFCDLLQLFFRWRIYFSIDLSRHAENHTLDLMLAHKQRCVSKGINMAQKPVLNRPQTKPFTAI